MKQELVGKIRAPQDTIKQGTTSLGSAQTQQRRDFSGYLERVQCLKPEKQKVPSLFDLGLSH